MTARHPYMLDGNTAAERIQNPPEDKRDMDKVIAEHLNKQLDDGRLPYSPSELFNTYNLRPDDEVYREWRQLQRLVADALELPISERFAAVGRLVCGLCSTAMEEEVR